MLVCDKETLASSPQENYNYRPNYINDEGN